MKKKLLVYIASPYSSLEWCHDSVREVNANVRVATRVGVEVIKLGHVPFVPHFSHYLFLEMSDEEAKDRQNKFWYDFDLAFLDVCDALLYWRSSKGADFELEYARKKGKLIFYSLKELREWREKKK